MCKLACPYRVAQTICDVVCLLWHWPKVFLQMANLVIDVRERALIELFNRRAEGHHIEALSVGDVQCEYTNGQKGWIVERKSAHDFAASLCDNRYQEQRSRLLESNFTPIYIIEGDLRQTPLYQNIILAMVSLQLRGIHVFRTVNIEEAFCLLVLLVEKLESPPPKGITEMERGIKPPPRSKREREASPRTSFVRILRCIPGISQDAATRLVDQFETLPALQRALAADAFPKVQLSHGNYIGKTRLKRLRSYLLEELATPQ